MGSLVSTAWHLDGSLVRDVACCKKHSRLILRMHRMPDVLLDIAARGPLAVGAMHRDLSANGT